jgi:type II secretory pathway component PulK
MNRSKQAWQAVREELRAGPIDSQRGVAFVLVLLAIGILIPFTSSFLYKADIHLTISTNMKEETVAYYHARSAMEVARLVIKSQNEFDNMKKMLAGMIPNFDKQNIELWTFACEFAKAFCTGKLKLLDKEFFNFTGMQGVGLERGGMCDCKALPEDGRVNINRVDSAQEKQQLFMDLYTTFMHYRDEGPTDPRELDREVAEMVGNIIDAADSDDERTQLVMGKFQSSGAENQNKTTGKKPKNAKFDTLAELKLVANLDPTLYCKAANELTPYSTKKLNVNTAELHVLRRLVCEHTTNAEEACYGLGSTVGLPAVDHAMFCIDICRSVRQKLMSPGFGNVGEFLSVFDRLPAEWLPRPVLDKNALSQKIGVNSKVIRVETLGGHFQTFKGLTAVIDTGTGNYVYWREY